MRDSLDRYDRKEVKRFCWLLVSITFYGFAWFATTGVLPLWLALPLIGLGAISLAYNQLVKYREEIGHKYFKVGVVYAIIVFSVLVGHLLLEYYPSSSTNADLHLDFVNSRFENSLRYGLLNASSTNAKTPQVAGKVMTVPKNPNDTYQAHIESFNDSGLLPPFIPHNPVAQEYFWVKAYRDTDNKHRVLSAVYYSIWCENCSNPKHYWVMLEDTCWVASFDLDSFNFDSLKANPIGFIDTNFPKHTRKPIIRFTE